jgi:hypothetical protein
MYKFQEEGPETFVRGKQRIDLILGTHDLLFVKEKVGILNYDEGFPGSDHCMVYIDLLESVLLDGHTQDVTRPRARGFNTKDKE